jgi:hypothetical protein
MFSKPLRLTLCWVAAAALFFALPSPSAVGEAPYPTSQLASDRGSPLPYSPPPPQPAGICMIDSGVNLNPSTQPEVVYREALDGGDPGDVSPIEHGTLMAMEAAAPPNGWGMIGAAPGAVRIISIRAESATDALTFDAYKEGINRCQVLAATYNIKVVNLSIGFQAQPTPDQLVQLRDAASRARNYGLDVVAAAGDEGSQTVSYPAAQPPILAVGAAGALRTICPFSNTGPQVALLAPGCDLQEADPATGTLIEDFAGTSQASAITAAVLAALRAYRPDLGPVQAEQLLTSTAQSAGGVLDVTALFQAAGLGSVIAAGQRNEPSRSVISDPPELPALPSRAHRVIARLPRPVVRLRRAGHVLFVRLVNLPSRGKAVLRLLGQWRGHRPTTLLRMDTRHRIVRLQVRARTLLNITYAPIHIGQAAISQARVLAL